MPKSRVSTLRAILQPKVVRIAGVVAISLGAYDAASSQFDLPRLSSVWGMSESFLPWWGWVLILQTIFIYALFEYVRRTLASPASSAESAKINEASVRNLAREEVSAYASDFVAAFTQKDIAEQAPPPAPLGQMTIISDFVIAEKMAAFGGRIEADLVDQLEHLDAVKPVLPPRGSAERNNVMLSIRNSVNAITREQLSLLGIDSEMAQEAVRRAEEKVRTDNE